MRGSMSSSIPKSSADPAVGGSENGSLETSFLKSQEEIPCTPQSDKITNTINRKNQTKRTPKTIF